MADPLIFTAALRKDDGNVDIRPSSDEYGLLEGMAFYGDAGEAGVLSYGASTKMPGTLSKGVPEADPNYAKWLGSWNVERQKKSFDGTSWVADGDPMTDTWVIEQKDLNTSFTITGLYGRSFPVEASFDAATGSISVACQEGVGSIRFQGDDYDCSVNLYGGVMRPDGGNYRITGTYDVFTASLSGDNAATLTPGQVTISSWGSDPVDLSYARFYAYDPVDGKNYIFDDGLFVNLPNTMRRASTSSTNYLSNTGVAQQEVSVSAVAGRTYRRMNYVESAPQREKPADKPSVRILGNAIPKSVKF